MDEPADQAAPDATPPAPRNIVNLLRCCTALARLLDSAAGSMRPTMRGGVVGEKRILFNDLDRNRLQVGLTRAARGRARPTRTYGSSINRRNLTLTPIHTWPNRLPNWLSISVCASRAIFARAR